MLTKRIENIKRLIASKKQKFPKETNIFCKKCSRDLAFCKCKHKKKS